MILRPYIPSMFVLLLAVSAISCGKKTPGNISSPATVSEVMDGTRTTANAALLCKAADSSIMMAAVFSITSDI